MINFTADMHGLMDGVVNKDQNAFATLYDCTHRPLFGAINSILRTREDAEEILLETFMMVWEKAASFDRSKGSAYGWVLTMARNRAIDRLRSYAARSRLHDEFQSREMDDYLCAEEDEAFAKACRLQRIRFLKSALNRIPDEQRTVIEEAYLKGFSQTEVAENLDLPLGTVKTRTRKGLVKLRGLLSENMPGAVSMASGAIDSAASTLAGEPETTGSVESLDLAETEEECLEALCA